MSEKEYAQQIRYSYSISLLRAISMSLGVMLVISVLVLLGDLITTDGASVPIIILLTKKLDIQPHAAFAPARKHAISNRFRDRNP